MMNFESFYDSPTLDLINEFRSVGLEPVTEGFGSKAGKILDMIKRAILAVWKKITTFFSGIKNKIKEKFTKNPHYVSLKGKKYSLTKIEDITTLYNEYTEYQNRTFVAGAMNHRNLIIPSLVDAINTIKIELNSIVENGMRDIMGGNEDSEIVGNKSHSNARGFANRVNSIIAKPVEEYKKICVEAKTETDLKFSDVSSIGLGINIVEMMRLAKRDFGSEFDKIRSVFEDETAYIDKLKKLEQKNLTQTQSVLLDTFVSTIQVYLGAISTQLLTISELIFDASLAYTNISTKALEAFDRIIRTEGGLNDIETSSYDDIKSNMESSLALIESPVGYFDLIVTEGVGSNIKSAVEFIFKKLRDFWDKIREWFDKKIFRRDTEDKKLEEEFKNKESLSGNAKVKYGVEIKNINPITEGGLEVADEFLKIFELLHKKLSQRDTSDIKSFDEYASDAFQKVSTNNMVMYKKYRERRFGMKQKDTEYGLKSEKGVISIDDARKYVTDISKKDFVEIRERMSKAHKLVNSLPKISDNETDSKLIELSKIVARISTQVSDLLRYESMMISKKTSVCRAILKAWLKGSPESEEDTSTKESSFIALVERMYI